MFSRNLFAFLIASLALIFSSNTVNAQNITSLEEDGPVILDVRPELLVSEDGKLPDDAFDIYISPFLTIKAPNIDHIPFFQSKIVVKANGMATVSEEFHIITTENTKNMPFFRTIPRKVETPLGTFPLNIDIKKVTLNGNLAQFSSVKDKDNVKIYVGESEKGLPLGANRFTFQYLIPDALNDSDKDKVFVWPITDTSWIYPITRAALVVEHMGGIVPSGQNILFNNATDPRTKSHLDENGNYSFVKNDIIYPKQSTVVLEVIPKKNLGKVSFLSMFYHFITTNLTALIYSLGLIFILSYYTAVWFNAKKEKRSPLNPSQSGKNRKFLSPSALGIYLKGSLEARNIVTAFISLAVNGLIKIEEIAPKQFNLVRQISDKKVYIKDFEKKLLALLFPKGVSSVEINKELGDKLTKHRRGFEFTLNREYDKYFLKVNKSYFIFGIAVTLASLIAGAFAANDVIMTAVISFSMSFILLLAVSFCFKIMTALQNPNLKDNKLKIFALFSAFFFVVVAGIADIYLMALYTDVYSALTLSLMLISIFSAYNILKKESKLGKIIKDSINLYEEYLSQTTKFANLKANPKKATELFDEHLPFAIIEEKEAVWSTRFCDIPDAGELISLPWYKGENTFNASFAKDLVARMIEVIENDFLFVSAKVHHIH